MTLSIADHSFPRLARVVGKAGMFTFAAICSGQSLYNNFGPAGAVSPNGWCVSGANTSACGPMVTRWIAASFTPSTTANLGTITLALTYSSGTNGAVINLRSDANGTPGTVLESWTASNLSGSTVTVTSKNNGSLQAGQTYWVEAEGLAGDTLDYWNTNSQGLTGGGQNIGNSGWSPLSGYGGQTQPAFSVTAQNLAGSAENNIQEYPVVPAIGKYLNAGIALGPDGALWFAPSGGVAIGRITTSGVVTEYPLPTGFLSQGPIVTAEGALWFAMFSPALESEIGRITTAGTVTHFSIDPPGSSYYISDMTVGPDGAIWLAGAGAQTVGRITTSGAYSHFSSGSCPPISITTGPDGNLWFTCDDSYTIGRLTTGGALTTFPAPDAVISPHSITPGPDGALWFTIPISSQEGIGRITTSGVVTTFSFPASYEFFPNSIATGPDGALWFTGTSYPIGRITTGGAITIFTLPNEFDTTFGIVAGPDGAMWFPTQSFTNGGPSTGIEEIGRIPVGTLPTQPTITKITPNTIPANSGTTLLQIIGTGLQGTSASPCSAPATSVTWNGTTLIITASSANEVDVAVPATLLTVPGTFTVTVTVNAINGSSCTTLSASGTVQVGASQPSGSIGVSTNSLSFVSPPGQVPPPQTFSVTSTSGTLPYTVSTTYAQPAFSNWLAVSPANGTASPSNPSQETVSVNSTVLTFPNGTYTATINVNGSGSLNTPNARLAETIPNNSVTVTVQVSHSQVILVASPSSVTIQVTAGQKASGTPIVIAITGGSSTLQATASGTGLTLVNSAPNTYTPMVDATNLTSNETASATFSCTGGVTCIPVVVSINIVVTPLVQNGFKVTGAMVFGSVTGPGAPSGIQNTQALFIGTTAGSIQYSYAIQAGPPSGTAAQPSCAGSTTPLTATASWLHVNFAAGLAPENVQVSVQPSGLAPGTYVNTIVLTSTAKQTVQAAIAVYLVVENTADGTASFTYALGGGPPMPQALNNLSSHCQTPAATLVAGAVSDQGWLSASLNTQNPNSASLTITAVPTGSMSAGTYYGVVTLLDIHGTASVTLCSLIVAGRPAISGVSNGASFQTRQGMSPGEIVTFFGQFLGPPQIITAQLDANGRIANTLSGCQVIVDGTGAPLVYASNTQTTAILPYELAAKVGQTVGALVTCGGIFSTPFSFQVVDADPGIFSTSNGTGQGAILNQDGSYNSAQNPAAINTIVQIFGTGEGQLSPAGQDGRIETGSLASIPQPVEAVGVLIGGMQSPQVTYARVAPGSVDGLLQVNAQVPAGLPPGPAAVILQVGSKQSQSNLTLAIK